MFIRTSITSNVLVLFCFCVSYVFEGEGDCSFFFSSQTIFKTIFVYVVISHAEFIFEWENKTKKGENSLRSITIVAFSFKMHNQKKLFSKEEAYYYEF